MAVQVQRSDAPPATSGQASGQATPAFYKRRRRRDNEIGQVLLRRGDITPQQLREALKIQVESGGHVGAILRRMGACDGRAIAEALIEQVRLGRERGKARSLARRARENPAIIGLNVRCRPRLVIGLLAAADALALSLGAVLVWLITSDDALTLPQRYGVAGLVPLCMSAFYALSLYSVTPPSPPEEIRSITVATTLVYAGSWIVAVFTREGSFGGLAHGAWLLGWLISVLLVPIGRGVLRGRLSKQPWWGLPVVVFGAGRVGRAVV
ncbi:MAG TPA: hypothetical protein VIM73_00740, partial [Polyangiaceae bacterium]